MREQEKPKVTEKKPQKMGQYFRRLIAGVLTGTLGLTIGSIALNRTPNTEENQLPRGVRTLYLDHDKNRLNSPFDLRLDLPPGAQTELVLSEIEKIGPIIAELANSILNIERNRGERASYILESERKFIINLPGSYFDSYLVRTGSKYSITAQLIVGIGTTSNEADASSRNSVFDTSFDSNSVYDGPFVVYPSGQVEFHGPDQNSNGKILGDHIQERLIPEILDTFRVARFANTTDSEEDFQEYEPGLSFQYIDTYTIDPQSPQAQILTNAVNNVLSEVDSSILSERLHSIIVKEQHTPTSRGPSLTQNAALQYITDDGNSIILNVVFTRRPNQNGIMEVTYSSGFVSSSIGYLLPNITQQEISDIERNLQDANIAIFEEKIKEEGSFTPELYLISLQN